MHIYNFRIGNNSLIMTQNAETIVTIITKFDVKYKNFFGQNIQWKKISHKLGEDISITKNSYLDDLKHFYKSIKSKRRD